MKEADQEQYLKRGTLAVLGVMKDLLRLQTPLLVSFSRGQFISRMLAADEGQLLFDLGSNNLDNDYALNCDDLSITAETYGAKVEFSLAALTRVEFEGLPALARRCLNCCGRSSVANFSASMRRWNRSSGATPSGPTAIKRACDYRIYRWAESVCWWMNPCLKGYKPATTSKNFASSWANMVILKCR